MTHEQLSLMTLQKLLRQQELRSEPELAEIVRNSDPLDWNQRMSGLYRRGWSEDDLDHWVWILSGQDADTQIHRFFSTESQKPLFLILLLMQSSQAIRAQESLQCILDYVSKSCGTDPPANANKHLIAPKYAPYRKMTTAIFLMILRRLTRHVLRIWPAAIVALAIITRNYIQKLPSDDSGYQRRCSVFNSALLLFGWPATPAPYRQMELNWRAQKCLLAMSDAMDRPLIINKLSYQSIRRVMLAQKKSVAERTVATRYAKSWPPYRQDFDGHDAKRTPDDDLSRSVKAGILMTEAGYQHEEYDAGLGALGGMTLESPTIQTRSLPSIPEKGQKETDHFYFLWAMKVRSTRNAHEAWKAFTSFSDEQPNIQVFFEMFIKLQARPADPSRGLLPGDSREVWPVHDANYSEYERSRLEPPPVQELYDYMLNCGIKPNGLCLQQLVSNAQSVEEGLRYLQDSDLKSTAVSQLALWKEPSYQALRQIPLLVFKSYIQLLCRLQPDRRGRQRLFSEELQRVRHAYKLTSLRLRSESAEGATFKPAWHAIIRALAKPYVALTNSDPLTNDIAVLEMSLDVYLSAERATGLDTEMFIYLCRVFEKVAISYLDMCDETSSNSPDGVSSFLPQENNSRLGSLLNDAREILTSSFKKLTTSIEQSSENSELPRFGHSINPVQLHVYMRVLSFIEDLPGMVKMLDWMFENRVYINEEAERKGNNGHSMIAKTLCAFEAFGSPRLAPAQRDVVDQHMQEVTEVDPTWRWPTTEEVDDYIIADRRGGSYKLHQLAISSRRKRESEMDQGDKAL